MGKVKIRAGESDDCDRCLGRSINYCNAHRKGADINLISTFCICRRYFRLLYLSSEDGVRKDLSGGTTVGATSRELVAIRVTREMVMLRMLAFRPVAVLDDSISAADLQESSAPLAAAGEGGGGVKKPLA